MWQTTSLILSFAWAAPALAAAIEGLDGMPSFRDVGIGSGLVVILWLHKTGVWYWGKDYKALEAINAKQAEVITAFSDRMDKALTLIGKMATATETMVEQNKADKRRAPARRLPHDRHDDPRPHPRGSDATDLPDGVGDGSATD